MSESLPELLAAEGVRLKSLKGGHVEKLRCTKCDGGRTRENSLRVAVDEDGAGAVMQCYRGHCGWKHGVRLPGRSQPAKAPRQHVTPPPVEVKPDMRPDSLYEFFDLRGISCDTVDDFGLYLAEKSFRDGDGWVKQPCIVFPYLLAGEVVNRKYRGLADKNAMMQEKDPLPTLYNIDSIPSDADEVIWVEGEPDVMACHEAGFRQIVSLKDGAPDRLKNEDDPARGNDRRFAALDTHAGLLAGVQKFILAGDNDQPGEILREELGRRLGRHRCWTVEWPDGCKDAGDVLRKLGPDALREAIGKARPWPIEGVRSVTGKSLVQFQRSRPPATMTTGVRSVDEKLALPTEGRQVVVTGFPNHGKTTWVMNLIVHTAEKYGRKWAIYSPEMEPVEEFALQIAQIYLQLPARPNKANPNLVVATPEQIFRAGEWMRDKLFFITNDAEDKPPTLDWLLEKWRDCVMRYGVTDGLLDPFNQVEQNAGNEPETKFIGRALQRFKAFGRRHGCNQWIIAHPAKPARDKNGAIQGAPGPYDISGSAHWANSADLGITIHTPDATTQAIIWKARWRRFGRKGEFANMQMNTDTGRYFSP